MSASGSDITILIISQKDSINVRNAYRLRNEILAQVTDTVRQTSAAATAASSPEHHVIASVLSRHKCVLTLRSSGLGSTA